MSHTVLLQHLVGEVGVCTEEAGPQSMTAGQVSARAPWVTSVSRSAHVPLPFDVDVPSSLVWLTQRPSGVTRQ